MALDFPNSPIVGQEFSASGKTWRWNGSKWISSTSALQLTTLNDVGDVNITAVSNGQIIKWNGSEWVNAADNAGTTISSIDDITDVTITSAATGQFLKWNGTAWVNDAVDLGTDTTGNYMSDLTQGTGVTITHTPGEGSNATIAIGQSVATSASVTFANVTAPLVGNVTGDLTGNADTATALETARTIELSGDVSGSASFDGTSNINIFTTVNTASVALNELYGVNITDPLEFQTLEYNGTEWVNANAQSSVYVRNAEATTITTGTAVYLFGATGDHATVKLADNTSDTTSSKTVGLVANNILSSENGVVVTQGYVDGIDLSVGYTPGDILWLGKNGAFTTAKPSAPDHLVFIGVVVRATNNGIVYVSTQNGYEIEELHNVKINGVTDGQFLRYNSASTVWVNDTINLGTDTAGDYVQSLVAGTGVTLTNNSGETATPTVAIGQDVGTSASVSFAQLSTSGDLTVGGNFTVNGTTTTLNTETLSIEDNIIVLNSNVSASPSLNAGIEIERGTSINVALRWNEADDKWQFTNDGSTYVDFGAGGATISETAPASPTAGQVWFESDTAQTFVYYDSQWIEIGASGMAAIVSDSAPSSPIPGQMWFNSLNGGTYIYYSSAWTEVGAVPVNALLNTINAKGDLLVGNADNSVARLAVGTDGYFLKALSSEATGLVWAAIPSVSILDDVGDVVITSASVGQVLEWNGSAWINATVSTDIMTSSKNAALLVMDIGV